MTLTDTELADLYQNETFPGSFSGARTFQQFLKTEKNENVPLSQIYKVLKSIPNYMYTLKPIKRFPRRQYDVKGYLELVQCDLGQMYEFNGMKYFLLVTDVFSSRIWCEPLPSKGFLIVYKTYIFLHFVKVITFLLILDTMTVRKAFQKIFDEMGEKPTHISSDQVYKF